MYELITKLTYDKSDIFLKNIFEVEFRSFAIKSQIKNTSNYVIICPTILNDYDNLKQISTNYATFCKVNKKMQFLNRNYGSRSNFNDKIIILNDIWKQHDIYNPLFYSERINQIGDPCLETSLLFTIFVPNLNGAKPVGDIWLSHIELCNIEFYKGSVERTTMIDYKFQSNGIGQTAVKTLYKLVINKWVNKQITFINSSNKIEKSDMLFNGVYSFVDYRNFKSLGNNIKSENTVIGISEKEPNMIIFRAINKNYQTPKILANIDMHKLKLIVEKLINNSDKNEYENAIILFCEINSNRN